MPCRNALCACRRVPRQQGAASVRSESSGEPRVCRQLWGPPLAGKPLLMHHGNLRCAVPCHGCYDSAAAPSVPGALMPVDEVSSGNCLPYPSCHSVFSLAVMQAGKCEGWHRAHAQYDFRQPLQNSTPSKWPGMRSGWDAGKGNNGGGGGCIRSCRWPDTQRLQGRAAQGNIAAVPQALLEEGGGADVWLLAPPCQPYTRRGLRRGSSDGRAASFMPLLRRLQDMRVGNPGLVLRATCHYDQNDRRH